MKKFSKIFLVLLTLSLIFGTVMSVVASAATEDCCEMLSVSGASHNLHSDFESSNTGSHKIVPAFAWASGQKGNVYVTTKTGSDGNTYVNYSAKNKESTSSSTIEGWVPVSDYSYANQRNGQSNIGAHDYVTIDFEIGTDMYSYKDSKGVWHTVSEFEDIPAEYRPAEPHRALALYNGMSLNINGRGAPDLSSAGSSASTESNFTFVYTVQDSETGKWYLGSKSSYGADDGVYIELSNQVGVFDHVTFVFQVVRTADSARTTGYNIKNTKIYTFLNGEYLTASNMNVAHDSVAPNAIRFFVPEADRTSLCLDNVAINWYGHRSMVTESSGSATIYKYSTPDSVYSSAGYGLDDLITSGDYAKKPIYLCEDVAYGVNYSFVASRTAAELVHLDGTVAKYANAFVASQNVCAGDFVHMYASFYDFTPANAEVDEVTFISYNGTALTLSDVANQFYKLQHTGDRYTIRLATDGIVIKWLDKKGDDANVLKQHVLIPFVAPSNESDELQIFGGVTYENNTAKIGILKSWVWDNKVIEGIELADIFNANSVETLNKFMEMGLEEIVLVPEFEAKDLVYAILPADAEQGAYPDFVVDDYDYDSFTDSLTFVDAVNKITANDDVKIVLYSDVNMINDDLITVAEGATLNLDLNGHIINSTVEDPIIKIFEGSVLNLYSTVAGGCIKSKTIITSKDIDSATINIGEMLDEEDNVIAAGDNIKLEADSIIFLAGSDKDVANSKKITINLNGGVYYSTKDSYSVLFNISEMDMVINISDAYIDAVTAFDQLSNVAASAEISISDSTVIASRVIGDWSKSNKMAITGSKIVGLNLSCENVVLGSSNYVKATNLNSGNIAVSKGVNVLFASEGKLNLTISGSSYNFSFATFVEKTDLTDVDIVDVIWLDPNGDEYATTYWVAGSVVDKSLVSADGFGIDKSTENAWFTKAYSTWKKADGTDDVVTATSNKFQPVAERPVESLSAVHVSLDISDTFKYNVYLPTPVSGVVFDCEQGSGTGFFDENGNLITSGVFKNVTVNETAGWTQLSIEVAADSFVADTIVIRFNVGNYYLTKTITLDIFDYINKVEAAYDGCTDEVQLVYAMLAYKLDVYKKATGSDADIDIILAVEDQIVLHKASCTCKEVNYDATVENVDYSAIAATVKEFAYTLELDGTDNFAASYAFSIYFHKAGAPEAVSVAGKQLVKFVTDEYVEFRLSLSLADLNDVIEINVDGITVTYSLAKYVAETDSSLAKALYVISAAATEN